MHPFLLCEAYGRLARRYSSFMRSRIAAAAFRRRSWSRSANPLSILCFTNRFGTGNHPRRRAGIASIPDSLPMSSENIIFSILQMLWSSSARFG